MIVFVHGVPETAALWNKVRANLGAESVALSLPGFGCSRPQGFGATKDDYVEWLVAELAGMDRPIDLVGHDWGAGLTFRVATAHGHLLRSWVADVANVMHPDYRWHEFARIWQTPGDGEAFFRDQQSAPPESRAVFFEASGVHHDDAVALAAAGDETMASCILDLYRSAMPNPYAEWGVEWAPTSAPGLVLFPTEDAFGDEQMSRQVAESLGARHEPLQGLGHWWPLQGPEAATAVIRGFLDANR